MAEDHPDDGVHSSAMANDGVNPVPNDSAKVGDKSKLDKAKYPADPTKGDADLADDDQNQTTGAAD